MALLPYKERTAAFSRIQRVMVPLRPAVTLLVFFLACFGCNQGEPTKRSLPPLPPIVARPTPEPGTPRPVRRLNIAYVGEVRGEIEPCGCPTLPYGGFERRAALLGLLQGEAVPLVHLDAGQLLVQGFATGGRGDAKNRAALMLDLSREVGVDAWVPGSADITAIGLEALVAATGNKGGPPLTSATWVDAAGRLVAPPYLVIQKGEVRVAVIGLSTPPPSSTTGTPLQMLDPVFAADAAVSSLPDNLDLVVGLSNLPEASNDQVASESNGMSVILSTRGEGYDEPRRIGDRLVIEVPNRGRYVGVLHLWLAGEPGQPVDIETAERLSLRERDLLEAQVRHLDANPSLGTVQLAKSRDQLQRLDQRLRVEGMGRNLAWWESVPLGSRYDGDQRIRQIIDRYKHRTLDAARVSLEQEKQMPQRPTRYMSSAACVTCHSREFARWSLTEHAKAWESLVQRGQTRNPECVGCHATGFAQPGGWIDTSDALIRQYKAVQCESCHGPMEGHPKERTRPPVPVTVQTCLTCHDEANSPQFDFQTWFPRASCIMPDSLEEPPTP